MEHRKMLGSAESMWNVVEIQIQRVRGALGSEWTEVKFILADRGVQISKEITAYNAQEGKSSTTITNLPDKIDAPYRGEPVKDNSSCD